MYIMGRNRKVPLFLWHKTLCEDERLTLSGETPVMREKGEEEQMKKYEKDGRLASVICNHCGRKLAVKQGIVREGAMIMHGTTFQKKTGRFIILTSVRNAMMNW